MESITTEDILISPQGRRLTVVKWLPDSGFFVKGKWLLRDERGTTMQLSTIELVDRGYIVLVLKEVRQ